MINTHLTATSLISMPDTQSSQRPANYRPRVSPFTLLGFAAGPLGFGLTLVADQAVHLPLCYLEDHTLAGSLLQPASLRQRIHRRTFGMVIDGLTAATQLSAIIRGQGSNKETQAPAQTTVTTPTQTKVA